MKYRIIAFYTKDTPYEQEVLKLKASLDALKLDYYIQGIPSQGSWVHNCGYKPTFILQCMCRFKEDILYVDADAIFRSMPEYYDTFKNDIIIRYKGTELVSNTIYLHNVPKIRHLVSLWIQEQTDHPEQWDQVTLDRVINNLLSGKIAPFDLNDPLTVTQSPIELAQIFDEKTNTKPVIEHFQASRRFKGFIHDKSTKLNSESIYDGTKVPTLIDGKRPKIASDGTFFLPVCNPRTLRQLNAAYIQVPGEMRWSLRPVEQLRIDELLPLFEGKMVQVIGKGPSLDKLKFSDLSLNCPIVCVNQSIHVVESLLTTRQNIQIGDWLFAIQQDIGLKDSCMPRYGKLFVSRFATDYYPGFNRKYVYVPEDFGLKQESLTVLCAIAISKLLRAGSFRFLCFDGAMSSETPNPLPSDLAYAKKVPGLATDGGDPSRFLKHKKLIDEATSGFVTWFLKPE